MDKAGQFGFVIIQIFGQGRTVVVVVVVIVVDTAAAIVSINLRYSLITTPSIKTVGLSLLLVSVYSIDVVLGC